MATLKGGLLLKQEAPTGTVDGVNVDFTTSRPYIAGTLMVFLNGILQSPGDDYTETSPTGFQMINAPQIAGSYTDKLRVAYQVK